MNVTEAIRSRRSIRKYQKGAVIPQEDIDMMLEAAMMAPSARNTRPWEFVAVENREVLEKFQDIQPYTGMMKTASLAIVVCGRPDLQEGGGAFWPQDCGAAIENILLQALELGYGTCWCGFYPVEERVRGFQELLDVESVPLGAVAVGVADEHPDARGYYDKSRVKYLK
nr:nitroreductase family protein [uncultured Merdimonas sp.]